MFVNTTTSFLTDKNSDDVCSLETILSRQNILVSLTRRSPFIVLRIDVILLGGVCLTIHVHVMSSVNQLHKYVCFSVGCLGNESVNKI